MNVSTMVLVGVLVFVAVGFAVYTGRVNQHDEENFLRMVQQEAKIIQAIHEAAIGPVEPPL